METVTTKTFKFMEEVSYKSDDHGILKFETDNVLCRIEKNSAAFNILIAPLPNSTKKLILNLSDKVYRNYVKSGVIEQVSISTESIH